MKKSLVFSILTALLWNQSALADIRLLNANQDACSAIQGEWKGSGTIRTYLGPLTIECRYTGRGVVTLTSIPNTFVMNNAVELSSGQCPDHIKFSLPGTCRNGKINFNTGEVNLDGTLSSDGKSADIKGTITIPLKDNPMEAEVENVHLSKL